MAAGVAALQRQDEVFRSVFPKANFTTPTPESTPNIGTISSPGVPFGGFQASLDESNETFKYNRAWSTVTRFLTLSPAVNSKSGPVNNDLVSAFLYLLGRPDSAKELVAWYANEIGTHFRGFVVPELKVWEQPIPVSKAEEVVHLTLHRLRRARNHYFTHLEDIVQSTRRSGGLESLMRFKTLSQRSFEALILHSLPRQRLQTTLTAVFYKQLEALLQQYSNPEKCLKGQNCSCKIDLSELPLAELSTVGLGGVVGERAFAYAMHRFLQGPAIERRCFGVDWTSKRSVVPRLRAWIETQVVPVVARALASIKAIDTFKPSGTDVKQLTSIAMNNIGRARTSSLFDYVKAWPASTGAVLDIWEYLNSGGQADKAHLCTSFTEQLQRRLLHAGATTAEILSIYVNTIHTFKALDGRGVLLEKVAIPIRNYLRGREDTVNIIAASFLADVDENGNLAPADADKACLDIAVEVSNTAIGDNSEYQMLNWDDMEWMPDPIDAGPDYHSSRSEDVVAQVLGLFDQEDFIKEVTTVLAQHLLHTADHTYVRETRLVELLKSRLDAAKLQAAEVMLRDMRLSVALGKRINPAVNYDGPAAAPTPREVQAAIPEEGITLSSLYSMFEGRIKRPQFLAAVKLVANKRNDLFFAKRTRIPRAAAASPSSVEPYTKFDTQILSSFFWPQMRSNKFNLPRPLEPLQTEFDRLFNAVGSQRRLHFRPALARVSMKLQLEDRLIEENDVPAWRASVVDAFASVDEPNPALTVEELVEVLQMEEELVLDALNFWTSKNVLYQPSPISWAVLERLDMDKGDVHQRTVQPVDDMVSAVKSQDAMLRESAPIFETFIANMLRNQGAKEIGGMMGITNLLKMVMPNFTYGDEEVRWLLGEMEKRGEVKKDDGEMWSVVNEATG